MIFLRNAIVPAALAAVLCPLMAISPADAAVVISSGATSNITCTSGVCTATAQGSVLNVTQLETMLASGNVTVNTKPIEPHGNINVHHAITWASSSTLTLNAATTRDSEANITIDDPIGVSGSGGLALVMDTRVDLFFGPRGNITFLSLTSPFTVNGQAYTLVDNIATLASGIAANPSGFFALAGSYDATPDGIYSSSPIPTTYTGTFLGLGNTISHLTAQLNTPQTFGMFEHLGLGGFILNLKLDKVSLAGSGVGTNAGALVGTNNGQIYRDTANVRITDVVIAGGLAAVNNLDIANCYTSGKIDTARTGEARAGGLVGSNGVTGSELGSVGESYSIVSVIVGRNSYGGGLVGYQPGGTLYSSYATGSITGGKGSYVGGLLGYTTQSNEDQEITQSYSTGAVTVGAGGAAGGLVGYGGVVMSSTYWDTTTSGISDLSQGAGTPANEPGITGLSTTQLQSGLPSGFNDSFWAESPTIYGGLPYLLPPQ